jgi:hypothetical protein
MTRKQWSYTNTSNVPVTVDASVDNRIFASDALAATVFDPEKTGKRTGGWTDDKPPSEYFNFIDKRQDVLLEDLEQRGVMGWSALTNYAQGALCYLGSNIYTAKSANIGQDPSVQTAIWGLVIGSDGALNANRDGDGNLFVGRDGNDIKAVANTVAGFGGFQGRDSVGSTTLLLSSNPSTPSKIPGNIEGGGDYFGAGRVQSNIAVDGTLFQGLLAGAIKFDANTASGYGRMQLRDNVGSTTVLISSSPNELSKIPGDLDVSKDIFSGTNVEVYNSTRSQGVLIIPEIDENMSFVPRNVADTDYDYDKAMRFRKIERDWDVGGDFSPRLTNTYESGVAGRSWADIRCQNPLIVTSDENTKTTREAFSNLEKQAYLAIAAVLGKYKLNDAIAAKGGFEVARYHNGTVAQEAVAAFDGVMGEGKAFDYGWICIDKIYHTEEQTVTSQREKKINQPKSNSIIEWVDGSPVRKTITLDNWVTEMSEPVQVVDEGGNPLFDEYEVDVLDGDGNKTIDEDGNVITETVLQPVMMSQPVMEDYSETVVVTLETYDELYQIRYDELYAGIIGAMV